MNYLEDLKSSILKATDDTMYIMECLRDLKGNTISIGSGGSYVVAEFASSVLSQANRIIANTLDPRDLLYADLRPFDNIFIASYSGSNFGVKSSILDGKNNYLLSNRKTKIKNEVLLHYDMEDEHSFISIKSTIIPMAILLKYYLQEKFIETIEDIFASLDPSLTLDGDADFINIYRGIDSRASASFLESTLTESAISVPLMHEKYSYCHGRSTINKNHNSRAIYLRNRNTDLDKAIISVLDIQMNSYVVIDSRYEDSIIDDFYLTLQCLIIVKNMTNKKKIDLKIIKYDKEAVKKLYYFKGSM